MPDSVTTMKLMDTNINLPLQSLPVDNGITDLYVLDSGIRYGKLLIVLPRDLTSNHFSGSLPSNWSELSGLRRL